MQPFLCVRTVGKQFGDTVVLQDVSFDLYKGEVLSLLGVNGAGKTTLSSLLATVHPVSSGTIEYQGRSIYEHLSQFRSKIGYCPQRPNLHGALTLYENLFFAGTFFGMHIFEITARIEQLSERFELAKYLSEKASVLSGGYKQRFMLARSLMHRPELIILDEPTVGLDPHIRRDVWQLIRELKNEGMTVLLTTHYLDEAEKLSDRVCILDAGRVKLIDTPDKLMQDFKQQNLEDVFISLLKSEQGVS